MRPPHLPHNVDKEEEYSSEFYYPEDLETSDVEIGTGISESQESESQSWQVLSKWIHDRSKKSYDINNMLSWHAIHAPWSVYEYLWRRKSDHAHFHLLKEGQRRPKNTFDKECTTKLAESSKGLFTTKKNCWTNSTTVMIMKMSASHAKILLQEGTGELRKSSWRSWKVDCVVATTTILPLILS